MRMLRKLMGVRSEPDMLHITRHPKGLPLYHGAYSRRLAAIDARLSLLPGLHLEANYKGGVSVRDRILCAEKVAVRILQQLDGSMQPRYFEPISDLVPNPVPATVTLR